jgi:hypothetical protein
MCKFGLKLGNKKKNEDKKDLCKISINVPIKVNSFGASTSSNGASTSSNHPSTGFANGGFGSSGRRRTRPPLVILADLPIEPQASEPDQSTWSSQPSGWN